MNRQPPRSASPSSRESLLIIGDGGVPTGFARVVRGIFEPLVERYNLQQLAVNYRGDPHDWPWPLYPAGSREDHDGADRIGELVERLEPRLVFLLSDVWRFPKYIQALRKFSDRLRIAAYCAIENGPIPAQCLNAFEFLDHLVLYSQAARRMVEESLPAARELRPSLRLPRISVLPHGVDTDVFQPMVSAASEEELREGRRQARAEIFPDRTDFRQAFVVLNANRNQPRKKIDLTLQAFSLFARDKPENVKIYLHMGMDDLGWNLPTLSRRYGIYERLIVTHSGSGMPEVTSDHLNWIYNACDVGINTALAEGWGLVSCEHAATGAPQIVPGFGTCEEIWNGAAELLSPVTRITATSVLMEGFLIDPAEAAAALERFYKDPRYRYRMGVEAYRRMTRPEYQWQEISRRWAELFDELLRDSPRQAPRRPAVKPLGARLPPPYIFVHIPKTGGTTLTQIVRQNFDANDFGHYWEPPPATRRREVARQKCIIGHLPHGIHEAMSWPAATYLTVLRNPLERVVSHYGYHLAETLDPQHRLAAEHSFEEWLDAQPDARNLMVQFLSGRKSASPTREDLELAKNNLSSYGVVGLLEHFESTLLLLQHFLGFEDLSYELVKVTPNRLKVYDFSAEEIAKARRANALDLELYRFAQELFFSQLEQASAMTAAPGTSYRKATTAIAATTYLQPCFTQHIDQDAVSTLFEVGSRDGQDAIQLRDAYQGRVYAFECNPEAVALCRKNLSGQHDITLVEQAAWHENATIPFYPVTESRMNGRPRPTNIGASSCFRARDDYVELYIQSETEIEAVRLDDFCRQSGIEQVDMVCMDVQGAALQALQGMGEALANVRYLIVELERKEIYHGQSLFEEVREFLSAKRFHLVEEQYCNDWFSNYLFIQAPASIRR